MQFDSINAFLDMGGYGFFVWLSYGVSLSALFILFFTSKAGHNKIKRQIVQRQKRENKLRAAAEQHKQQQNNVEKNQAAQLGEQNEDQVKNTNEALS